MQHWDRDPATGDYALSGGAPIQTDSLTIPAFIRTRAPRKGWLYAARDNKFGSDLRTLKRNATNSAPGLVETMTARALQPLVDDGRADAVTVATVVRAKYGLGVQIEITTAQGQQEHIEFLPIGG